MWVYEYFNCVFSDFYGKYGSYECFLSFGITPVLIHNSFISQ